MHGPRLAFDSWKTNIFEVLLPRLENTDNVDKARLERIRALFAAPELPMDGNRITDMRLEA
jgi:hypothetical protein